MLRIVVDRHVGAERTLPAIEGQRAGQHLEQGRLAGAVRPHQRSARAALDLEVDTGVHDVVAVRLVDALERGHPAAGPRRLGEREADHARLALDLDAVDAIEHLHPALDLPGLARLVSEALDEALDLGDTLGLVPCLRLEQLAARLSLDQILVVVTGVDGEP